MGHDVIKTLWLEYWPFARWQLVGQVEAADEVPERLPRRGAVLVGTPQHPKWIAFDCPCSLRHRVLLPLDKRHRPHWRMGQGKPLSLSPSIDALNGMRRCHYFITNGRTVWAHDEER